jgi:hypothetical protein
MRGIENSFYDQIFHRSMPELLRRQRLLLIVLSKKQAYGASCQNITSMKS